jgi:hypothetical protein
MRITEESQSHNCSLELILRPARSDAGAFLFAPRQLCSGGFTPPSVASNNVIPSEARDLLFSFRSARILPCSWSPTSGSLSTYDRQPTSVSGASATSPLLSPPPMPHNGGTVPNGETFE